MAVMKRARRRGYPTYPMEELKRETYAMLSRRLILNQPSPGWVFSPFCAEVAQGPQVRPVNGLKP